MDLWGPLGLLFLIGIAQYGAGFALAWVMLGRHGGLDRSKTLFVAFDEESPMKRPEHAGDRRVFRVGIFLMAFGCFTIFSGLSGGDRRELAVCAKACVREGFKAGAFAPSQSEKDAAGKPIRACWCLGPAGSVELPQSQVLLVPGLPQPAPSGSARH